jgi:phage-related protein
MPPAPEDDLKPLHWVASSKKDVQSFPDDARQDAGYNLHRVQRGDDPGRFDHLPQLGSGVMEIKISHDTDAYRVMYVAKFEEAIYVLDAFQKKSPRGSEIPRSIQERIRSRYQTVVNARPAQPVD